MLFINLLLQYFHSILDFENLTVESVGDHFKDRDVFFSCLGTTRRQAGSAVSTNLSSVET